MEDFPCWKLKYIIRLASPLSVARCCNFQQLDRYFKIACFVIIWHGLCYTSIEELAQLNESSAG